MNSKIKYSQEKDKLVIKIKPSPKNIIFFGVFLFFVIPSMIFIFIISKMSENFDIDTFLVYVAALIFFIVTWKYLKRLFEEEIIVVTSKHLLIYKRLVFNRSYKTYLIENIKGLKYIREEEFTEPVPMPKSFDYLGIGTGEKEMQFLAEEGNMLFVYNGHQIRFGKNLDEEDANEILFKIKHFNPQMLPPDGARMK